MTWKLIYHKDFRNCSNGEHYGDFYCDNGVMKGYWTCNIQSEGENCWAEFWGDLIANLPLVFRIKINGHQKLSLDKHLISGVPCATGKNLVCVKFYDSQGHVIKFLDGSEKLCGEIGLLSDCQSNSCESDYEVIIMHDRNGNVSITKGGNTLATGILSQPPVATQVGYRYELWGYATVIEHPQSLTGIDGAGELDIYVLDVEQYIEEAGGGGTFSPIPEGFMESMGAMMQMMMFMSFLMMLIQLITSLLS